MPISALNELCGGITRRRAMALMLSGCCDVDCAIPHGSLWMTPTWWDDNAPEMLDLLDPIVTQDQAAMMCGSVRREIPWKLAVRCLRTEMPWADFYAERVRQAGAAVRLARLNDVPRLIGPTKKPCI